MNYSDRHEQKRLFSVKDYSSTYQVESSYEMSCGDLQQWKQKIINYQQNIKNNLAVNVQATLFDLAPTHCNADAIDPFTIPLRPISFWRYPADSPAAACIYFVIDHACDLLLYVGETYKSSQRWKGVHDCKRYTDNYIYLHNSHNQTRQLGIGFWWDAPVATKPRQQLESKLIEKWKPPFNKQNWTFWQTPFISK